MSIFPTYQAAARARRAPALLCDLDGSGNGTGSADLRNIDLRTCCWSFPVPVRGSSSTATTCARIDAGRLFESKSSTASNCGAVDGFPALGFYDGRSYYNCY
jgi:hypothetical protein